MYFQRLNRSDSDKVFIRVKNAYSSASLTSGQAVCFAYNGTEDGVAVTRPATSILNHLAGVVKGTIAYGAYGDVQAYGYNSDALRGAYSGDTTIALGSKLRVTNGSFAFVNETLTSIYGESGVVIAGAAFTTTTAAAGKVFLRCL